MIRLSIKKNQSNRLKKRLKNKAIIRKKIFGDSKRPRLVVFRSHKHIYAQLVDDLAQKTLLESSSLEKNIKGLKKIEQADKVGTLIAKKAKDKGIKKVVFDRNGYLYHGRIQQVADGARKEGLLF